MKLTKILKKEKTLRNWRAYPLTSDMDDLLNKIKDFEQRESGWVMDEIVSLTV